MTPVPSVSSTGAPSTPAGAERPDPHRSRRMHTPIGPLTLVATDRGLRAVLWPDDDARVPLPATEADPAGDEVLDGAEEQLDEYFTGGRQIFDVPLDLRGTDFQVEVWRSLAEIPYGQTRSYSDQARRLGRPGASRAVGAAIGRNPVSIVLPCHRVVAADGSLHGYAGGLDAKARLIDHERRSADG